MIKLSTILSEIQIDKSPFKIDPNKIKILELGRFEGSMIDLGNGYCTWMPHEIVEDNIVALFPKELIKFERSYKPAQNASDWVKLIQNFLDNGKYKMKKIQDLYEITIDTNKKDRFKKYVLDYYQTLNKLAPILNKSYKNKDFNGLSDKIIEYFTPLSKKMDTLGGGSWEYFKEWIKGIDTEDLPIGSSGSFATGLIDTDWIQSSGEDLGLDDEEIEELIMKTVPLWNKISLRVNENVFDKKQFFINKALKAKSDKIASDPKFAIKPQQSDKKEIKNIDYFQQMLNQSRLSVQSRLYIQGVINSIKKQNNFASPSQISILRKFQSGNIA